MHMAAIVSSPHKAAMAVQSAADRLLPQVHNTHTHAHLLTAHTTSRPTPSRPATPAPTPPPRPWWTPTSSVRLPTLPARGWGWGTAEAVDTGEEFQ